MDKDTTILFSVVIPVHNGAPFIRRAVDSVLVQSFRSFELIIVDDSSTDATRSILDSYPRGQFQVECIRERTGVLRARRHGAGKAIGRYISFLDADDAFFPWTLKAYADVIREAGLPPILVTRSFRFENKVPSAELSTPPQWSAHNSTSTLILNHMGHGYGSNRTTYRADILRAIPEYQFTATSEDYDLFFRATDARGAVEITSPQTHIIYPTPNSLSSIADQRILGIAALARNQLDGIYPPGQALSHSRAVQILDLAKNALRSVRLRNTRHFVPLLKNCTALAHRDVGMRAVLELGAVFAWSGMKNMGRKILRRSKPAD